MTRPGQVTLASADAAAARVLAAGADRDVADVRAKRQADVQVLNALRETQLEQGRILDAHSRILDAHSRILDAHSREFAGIRREMADGFATVNTGMRQIVRLLEGLTPGEA